MAWETSPATHIYIFNVGRGNSAFIRTPLNQGFLLDMGNEGGEDGFSPAKFAKENFLKKLDEYKEHKIAQAILSHPHEDHVTECEELYKKKEMEPTLITCPHDKDGSEKNEKLNWNRIKNRDNELKTRYSAVYEGRKLPLQTIQFDSKKAVPPRLEYGIYYVRPPQVESIHADDNKYGNGTSIVFYYRHGTHSILFPGDITPECMRVILNEAEGSEKRYTKFDRRFTEQHPNWHEKSSDQPSLKFSLKTDGLSILVAPHHGLESCFCPELFQAMRNNKPMLNVISEKRTLTENDGNVHAYYQKPDGASGLDVICDGVVERERRSVSTKNGHHILIVFKGAGVPIVILDKSADKLLQFANDDGKTVARAGG